MNDKCFLHKCTSSRDCCEEAPTCVFPMRMRNLSCVNQCGGPKIPKIGLVLARNYIDE